MLLYFKILNATIFEEKSILRTLKNFISVTAEFAMQFSAAEIWIMAGSMKI